MKNQLKILKDLYNNNDRFKGELDHFARLCEVSSDLNCFKYCLSVLKEEIQKEMFSYRFTQLDLAEKDVEQRVYYQLNLWLDFFLRPLRFVNKESNLTVGKATPSLREE